MAQVTKKRRSKKAQAKKISVSKSAVRKTLGGDSGSLSMIEKGSRRLSSDDKVAEGSSAAKKKSTHRDAAPDLSAQDRSTVFNNLGEELLTTGYVADDTLTTALDLMAALQRPLLLEGEAGVGKTEVAKALASVLDTRLIRLQCYEGLDAHSALYEWNYQRQLLSIKARETEQASAANIEAGIFSEDYLLRRPLLQALQEPLPPVLLIDEIDRADTEFEAYLLEILSEYQITIPELGTITATSKPHVILTSNGTRELSDALRRRCLFCWIGYPNATREMQIVKQRLPNIENTLTQQVVNFVHALRSEELQKPPGIAETLDWAAALLNYNVSAFLDDLPTVQKTLLCLLKTPADQQSVTIDVTEKLAGIAN